MCLLYHGDTVPRSYALGLTTYWMNQFAHTNTLNTHTHTHTHTPTHTLSILTFSGTKWSRECKNCRNGTEVYICQFSDMCYIYQYLEGNGQVVNIVQVQRDEYQELTGCLKYCGCETQIYTRNKWRFSKKETWKWERNDANKLQSVTNECSVPYLCSFWILQKMARSSTDVCLRSSQGETDPGRNVRDPESSLFSGAESTVLLLRRRRQEWRNHLLK